MDVQTVGLYGFLEVYEVLAYRVTCKLYNVKFYPKVARKATFGFRDLGNLTYAQKINVQILHATDRWMIATKDWRRKVKLVILF